MVARPNCVADAGLTMRATILKSGVEDVTTGHWVSEQDELTGEIIDKWVEAQPQPGGTPSQSGTIDCYVSATAYKERFGEQYTSIETLVMRFNKDVVLSQSDQVTRITDKRSGEVLWVEEEMDKENGVYRPTTFNVDGQTILNGPFGPVAKLAILSKARNTNAS